MQHPSRVGASDTPDDPWPQARLDSWKEIAAYFKRDVRTVRRWERSEGLPVHRHLHRARGSVYASRDELDQWLAHRSPERPAGSERRPVRRAGVVAAVAGSLAVGLAAGAIAIHGLSVKPTRSADAAVPAPLAAGASTKRPLPAEPDVREMFLVARHQLARRTGFRQRALSYLETVTARVPGFADAQALLGEAYLRQALFDAPRRAEAWPRAEAAARRALALDDSLAAGHNVLGRILLLRDWNWVSAEAEILRAVQLDPEDPEARSSRALYLRSAGRLDEAIAEREHARKTDPLSPQLLTFLGDEYTMARRPEEAVLAYRRAVEIERDYRPAVAGLADALGRAGRHDEAAVSQVRWLRLVGRGRETDGFEEVRRRDGHAAAVRWLDRQYLLEFQRAPQGHFWDQAYLHARLGEREAAFRCLETAYEEREAGLLQARVDPDVDTLRSDRRFQELLRRIGPNP